MQQFEIVFNLLNYQNELFVPEAFVVLKNEAGNLTYAQTKLTPQTLSDYGFETTPPLLKLFDIIEKLQIPALELRFKRPNRKKRPLWQLLESKEFKKPIIGFFHRHLHLFLETIKTNNFLLGLDLERKDWVEKKQIRIATKNLEPNLRFKRNKAGVFYSLNFGNQGYKSLLNVPVLVLSNKPAWVLIDHTLYQIDHINGNMVKPFLKKDKLLIRNNFVKEYFEKFILKVASKVDVNAEGFDIIQLEDLKKCELHITRNFINNTYGIGLRFKYSKTSFDYQETRQQKTFLEFKKEEIIIYRNKRNPIVENKYITVLENMGLQGSGHIFLLPDTDNHSPYPVIEWLTANEQLLKKAGFHLLPTQIEEKTLYLAKPNLQLNLQQVNDWFDVFGVVEVGQFSIPFYELAKNIRNDNRFYLLPNGEYFVIPDEWMEKYKPAFAMGKVNKNSLRLTKAQFPILNNINFQNGGLEQQKTLVKRYEDIDYQPSNLLKAKLRPYQLEGVKWLIHLYHNQLGACLADDMGLGKTLQTIAALLYAKEQKEKNKKTTTVKSGLQLDMFSAPTADTSFYPLNALIILPASLVFNWEREIKKFAPHLLVNRHIGTKRAKDIRLLTNYDVILTTYQTARRDIELLKEMEYEYVVLDESQQIKNKDSKIFKAINELNALHKVTLSGTPIENSLADLWSQMQFINPELLGSFNFFKKEFIKPITKQQDEQKGEQLKTLIAPYLLRRTKGSVAKDLPPVTEKVFYTNMTTEQRKLYEKEKSSARNFILENFQQNNSQFNAVIIKTLLKLRQIANHPKLAFPDSDVSSGKFQDMLEHFRVVHKANHKILVFSQFVKHLELFKGHFEQHKMPFTWLTGATSKENRIKEVDRFNDKKAIQTFFISLKAGGTGLNLTSADYVFIADPWWNPAAEKQAIARAHRIGQTKNVIALKYIAKDTVEEKILKLQQRKLKLVNEFINHNEKISFSKKDLEFLLA